MAELIHFSKAGFDKLKAEGKPMIVDFWATWCGPCRMIAPAIEQLAKEYGDEVIVGKVDVDQEGDLAVEYGIMNIPCVIAIKGGAETERLVGARSYSDYAALAEKLKG